MEQCVNHKNKVAEIWLTKAEKTDSLLQSQLNQLYKDYQSQGYLVAVFQSGNDTLQSLTRDLLLFNRKRSAEKEYLQTKKMV